MGSASSCLPRASQASYGEGLERVGSSHGSPHKVYLGVMLVAMCLCSGFCPPVSVPGWPQLCIAAAHGHRI